MDGPKTDLVKTAILSSCTGDFKWVNDKEQGRAESNAQNLGLTGVFIRKKVQEWVASGGKISVHNEEREGYRAERDFYYSVIMDLEGFQNGLFVEIILTQSDPSDPIAAIVSAHPPTFTRGRK